MSEPKTKAEKKRRIRYTTEIVFLLSVVFCVTLSVIYLSRYSSIRSLMLREEELKQKVSDLERENRRLKESLDQLSTPEGIERLARERLGLVRPDEIVVFPIPDSDQPATDTGRVVPSP